MKEIIQEEEHQNNQKVIEEVGYLSGVYNFSILMGFFDRKKLCFFRQPKRFSFSCSLIDRKRWLLFYGFCRFCQKRKMERKKQKQTGNNTNRTKTVKGSNKKSPSGNKINDASI